MTRDTPLPTIFANRDEFNFEHPAAVKEAVGRLTVEDLRRYGTEERLKDELSAKHQLHNPNRIFLDTGIIGIAHRVFDNVLTPESEVLLSLPGYPVFHQLARRHGAKIRTYRILEDGDTFRHDVDELLEGIRRGPALAVITDPESPAGCSLYEPDLEKVLQASHDSTLVFLDQAHEGFRSVENYAELVEIYPNLLIARSFSKFHGLAGARIGYAICGNNVKNLMNFQEKYLGFNVPNVSIALAALASEAHYEQTAEIVRSEKKRFIREVEDIPGYRAYRTDTEFVLVRPPPEQIPYLEHHASAANVRFRNLARYDEILQDNSLTGLLRVTMSPPEDNDRVLDVFHSVGWLFDMTTRNTIRTRTMSTRDAGYTVHRHEWLASHTDTRMGWHKVIIPPGGSVPAHKHDDQDEVFFFESPGKIRTNNGILEVGPEVNVPVDAGEVHEIYAPADRFLRFKVLRWPYRTDDNYTHQGEQIIHPE